MCPEPDKAQPANKRGTRRAFAIALPIFALMLAFGAAVRLNAFGENISGTVHCTNSPVTGVYIKAERPLRQSRFSTWYATSPDGTSARFVFWLPYGGDYAIHFGCGSLPGKPGSWATDNRTPVVSGTNQNWRCRSAAAPVQTVVSTNCERVQQ